MAALVGLVLVVLGAASLVGVHLEGHHASLQPAFAAFAWGPSGVGQPGNSAVQGRGPSCHQATYAGAAAFAAGVVVRVVVHLEDHSCLVVVEAFPVGLAVRVASRLEEAS